MTTREYISPNKGYVVLGLTTTGPDCWSDLISKISLLIIGQKSEPEKYDIETVSYTHLTLPTILLV